MNSLIAVDVTRVNPEVSVWYSKSPEFFVVLRGTQLTIVEWDELLPELHREP